MLDGAVNITSRELKAAELHADDYAYFPAGDKHRSFYLANACMHLLAMTPTATQVRKPCTHAAHAICEGKSSYIGCSCLGCYCARADEAGY